MIGEAPIRYSTATSRRRSVTRAGPEPRPSPLVAKFARRSHGSDSPQNPNSRPINNLSLPTPPPNSARREKERAEIDTSSDILKMHDYAAKTLEPFDQSDAEIKASFQVRSLRLR